MKLANNNGTTFLNSRNGYLTGQLLAGYAPAAPSKKRKDDLLLEEKFAIFNNPEFGYIRTFRINGQPWFVGRDVATALGYAKPENAISKHVNAKDKTSTLVQGSGSNYKSKAIIINESGLYSLIFGSRLEKAKDFTYWVSHDVVPSIRETGYYSLINSKPDSYMIEDPVDRAKRWIEEQEEKKALEQKNQELETEKQQLLTQQEEDKPKIEVYNVISNTQNTITVARMAGILFDKEHIRISQKKLYDYLRDKGYLCTAEHVHNKPSQRMLDKGYMTYKEFSRRVYNHRSRSYKHEIRFTPCITGEGQAFITSQVLKSIDKGELVL